MANYKSLRIIDGKSRWVKINENKEIIDKNPDKDELIYLKKEPYIGRKKKYTKKQIIGAIIRFYENNGRVPVGTDFNNDSRYPSPKTVYVYFGNWDNAIRYAGIIDKRKRRREKQYDSGELLSYLIEFEKEYGRPPSERYFNNSNKYPHYDTFKTRFGSWNNALKLVGLDVESMIRKGVLITNQQKARLWELIILEYLGQNAIDLSGKNCASPIDGICPDGKTYDAKSSELIDGKYFFFNFHNKEKEYIEVFYLGAFNKDFTDLMYVWRIPGEIIETNVLKIWLNNDYCEYNIVNMREYDITYKFKDIWI